MHESGPQDGICCGGNRELISVMLESFHTCILILITHQPGAVLLHQSLTHEYGREEERRRIQITKEEEEEWHLTRKMKRASFGAD